MNISTVRHVFNMAVICTALILPFLGKTPRFSYTKPTVSASSDESQTPAYIEEMKETYSSDMKGLDELHGVKVMSLSSSTTGSQLLFKPSATSHFVSFEAESFRPVLNISTSKVSTILSLSIDASAQGYL